MKTIFIEAHSSLEIELPTKAFEQLPNRIALLTTVQHIKQLIKVKDTLEKNGKHVKLIKGIHSKHAGQILGCDVPELSTKEIDAFLYIGTGKFHPMQLLMKHSKPVFTYNPVSKSFTQLKDCEVEQLVKRQKGAILRFHASTRIGVLISTKHGQYNVMDADKLNQKYKEKDFYFLLFDTLDYNQLENFPFIECFVNTACPRIAYDDSNNFPRPVVNVGELL